MARQRIDPDELATVLKVGSTTLRNQIREECKAGIPDDLRFVPGGRVAGGSGGIVQIYRGIFDAVTSGRAVTHTPPTQLHPLTDTQPAHSLIRTRKVS